MDWQLRNRPMDANADFPPRLAAPDGPPGGPAESFDATLKRAFELHNAGRRREAEAICEGLLRVRPRDAQLLFLLGMIFHKEGRDAEAVTRLSLAAELDPRSARIFSGLGCAFQALKEHAHAAEAFERSLELDPKSGATYYNLGNTCFQLDEVERAAAMFRRAAELDSSDYQSWNNLGKCLKELNRLEESIAAYDRAVEAAPDYGLARYGRSIALLTAGRLKEGFRDYESRRYSLPTRTFPQPTWSGEAAPGRTLFLHAEQGFGDAIQMVRFIPAARERVGKVILECRPELCTLFQHSRCADVVIPYGTEIPPFDQVLSLTSLPHVLGITLDTIPNRTPYLAAPTARELPQAPAGHWKVGLVWAGNPNHHQDAARSIPFAALAPILQVPGVRFYSLQQPIPIPDEPSVSSHSGVLHSVAGFTDFLETAAVIAALDLVITVDTAVAHLAGALGKPVWLLLQHSPDWRWLLDRDGSPWYPTMQLFRQSERNQWALPILSVAEALQQKLPHPPSNPSR
jgi:tetratricopeptide (TPR) repeat protein